MKNAQCVRTALIRQWQQRKLKPGKVFREFSRSSTGVISRLQCAGWCSEAEIDGLASESLADANYAVGTVAMSGDGAGDQTVGSQRKQAGFLLFFPRIKLEQPAYEANHKAGAKVSAK